MFYVKDSRNLAVFLSSSGKVRRAARSRSVLGLRLVDVRIPCAFKSIETVSNLNRNIS